MHSFNDMLREQLKPLIDTCHPRIGTFNLAREKEDAQQSQDANPGKSRKRAKAKEPLSDDKIADVLRRDDKIYVNYNKSFEKFHVELISMSNAKVGGAEGAIDWKALVRPYYNIRNCFRASIKSLKTSVSTEPS